jgi:hypothetical protein
MLADRLEEITRHFSQNRDIHYREQLQALQIDVNLIMEAKAHGNEPLPNTPEEIDALVEENIKTVRKSLGPYPPPRAGKMYADFAKEVNDAMEERDAALTMHMVCILPSTSVALYLTALQRECEVRKSQIRAAHAYRMKLAAGEHRALANTIRDRLINSVTSKKNRLSRDKETLEISDSSALLLHPSQFGLSNPASPGGMHSKRATRHRRDADDFPTFPDSNKRKRRGDGDESPAPSRQRLDNGNSTPIWYADKHRMMAQQLDSALFSIDKLFTEKELAMTYNVAALAAHSQMQRHEPYDDDDFYSSSNGKSDADTEQDGTAAGDHDGHDDTDSPPSGAGMERQYSHATRSTRGAGIPNFVTGLGIDAISDLNFPGNMAAMNKQIPKLPPLLASTMQKSYVKGENANGVAGLAPDEANAELEIIRQARLYNDHHGLGRNLDLENGGRAILEAVSWPRKHDHYVKSDDKHMLESNLREQMPLSGGEPMSSANSAIGGIPMSRQNTGEGTSSRGRKLKPVASGN